MCNMFYIYTKTMLTQLLQYLIFSLMCFTALKQCPQRTKLWITLEKHEFI